MNLKSRLGLQRIWPLLFLVPAVWALWHANVYTNWVFARGGVPAVGWYTDVAERDIDCVCIHYAYQVQGVVYGGAESLNDEDSDIYLRHDGDQVSVVYLAQRPWISRGGRADSNKQLLMRLWIGISASFVVVGAVLTKVPRRERRALVAAA